MAGEPGVGLDRDRVPDERLEPLLDRVAEPVAVPLGGQVALELLHEQPAVREDENAHRPRAFDESGGGDRLPRRRRVAEAKAPLGAGVVVLGLLVLVLVVVRPRLLGELFVLGLVVPVAVPVLLALLVLRDELGEHPGQRVDLVAAELGPRREPRRAVVDDALEPEHERVAHLPLGRRGAQARLHLGERVVERTPPGTAGRQHVGGVLVLLEEGLARPGLGAERGSRQAAHSLRLVGRVRECLLHGRSARNALHVQGDAGATPSAGLPGTIYETAPGLPGRARYLRGTESVCWVETAFFMYAYASSVRPRRS